MTEGSPTRFRVVGGLDVEPTPEPEVKKPRRRKQPMKDTLKSFKCAKCSEELGRDYHQMTQVLRNPYEANGKIVGGSLWWACARCGEAYFLIRLFGEKKR